MSSETKVRNKTYEQFREEVKPDIYAEEGEKITCQNGHRMGIFACTSYVDDELSHLDWTGPVDANYMPGDPTKCECGSQFTMIVKRGPLRYSTVVRFWMNNEWRVKKYP